MKNLFCVVIIVMLLVGCRQQVTDAQIPRTYGQGVKDLILVTKSKVIDEVQVGFKPPSDMQVAPEDFVGWLLVFDKAGINKVYEHLQGMTLNDIEQIALIDGDNRAYLAKNFEWADGLGNTMNPGQKTLLEGQDYTLGTYHFYVATVTNQGVKGISQVGESMNLKPIARNTL